MFEIEETRIASGGLEFRALSVGQGPLVLLLHGFPDHAPSWRPLLDALAGHGFRAVAPWMRGYSPGAIPPNGSYHAASLGMDVLGLIDALGYRSAAVVGHHRVSIDW